MCVEGEIVIELVSVVCVMCYAMLDRVHLVLVVKLASYGESE